MANQYKNINGVNIELTDKEQAELDARKAAYDSSIGEKRIKREERDSLLAETDWMANSDVTMTDAWKTYRQALRDLPAADGFPDVDFPTKPS
jgi:hypothetical protein